MSEINIELLAITEDPPSCFGSLALWPDANFVLADAGSEVFVWDTTTKALVARHQTDASCRDGYPHLKLLIWRGL